MGKVATSLDWKTEPLLLERVQLPLNRLFSEEEMACIQPGLIPSAMEEKWFIYRADNNLYFHRSWSGYCVYVGHFVEEELGWRMVSMEVNRDTEQYSNKDNSHDQQLVHFLINVLLLGIPGNYPQASGTPGIQAIQMWTEIGSATINPLSTQENPADES